MVTKSKHFLWIVAICGLNFSCASNATLYSALTKEKVSLNYIHDSDKDQYQTDYKVAINKPVVTDRKFTWTGRLEKVSGYMVPLLIVNQWKYIRQYDIGGYVIKENIPEFVESAITEEVKRSGCFTPDTTSLHPGQFVLTVELDSLGAGGPHVNEGYVFYFLMFYGYSISEHAGPGVAYSRFHYKLTRDDEILMDDFVESKKTIEPLVARHRSTKELRRSYNASLVEGLSQTFKSNIEVIVEDIDTYLFELSKSKDMPMPDAQATVLDSAAISTALAKDLDFTERFEVPDKRAEFPGGINSLYKYLSDHVQFPQDVLKNKVGGKVFIEFVIDQQGKVEKDNIKVIKGVYPSLDAEAIRLVKSFPDWTPAEFNGKPIKSRYVLPIDFGTR